MRVRIPYVINPDGKWAAYGYPTAQKEPDWSMVMEVADNGEPESNYRCGWIEVDLPKPTVDTVSGDAPTVRVQALRDAAAIADGIADTNLQHSGKVFSERALTAQVIRDKINDLAREGDR